MMQNSIKKYKLNQKWRARNAPLAMMQNLLSIFDKLYVRLNRCRTVRSILKHCVRMSLKDTFDVI